MIFVRIELGHHKELIALNLACSDSIKQRLPHRRFVVVKSGTVKETYAQLKRRAQGTMALRPA